MDNFKHVAFIHWGRTVIVTRYDLPIKLNHYPSRPDLQRLKQLRHVQAIADASFFSVNANLHSKKNRIRKDHHKWPGNTVSSSPGALWNRRRTLTLALPYAGAIRIRFKGLPTV
jgi:hypothetical protein